MVTGDYGKEATSSLSITTLIDKLQFYVRGPNPT